jgi:hypothetical protein
MNPARTCVLALMAGLAACSGQPPTPQPSSSSAPPEPAQTPAPKPEAEAEPIASPASAPEPEPPARKLILAQWRKAENRARCAPLAFSDIGKGPATPRPARFSGGWAVAWDRPGMRSAFGLAGVSLIETDKEPAPAQRARLARQWPVFRELPDLPQPAFAGYGVEGATLWPDENPTGVGLNSLAYVRVGGQLCTYNVWSRLGRAHLERLLDGLREIEPR